MEMDWYTGGDLWALIYHGQMPEPMMAECFKDILCGLRHIHSNNIVHRDIKPPNILFDHGQRAWITDFGLSVRDDGNLRALAGTEKYQAPEMLRGW